LIHGVQDTTWICVTSQASPLGIQFKTRLPGSQWPWHEPPGGDKPVILPQILTSDAVLLAMGF